MAKFKTPLRYPGGKQKISPFIIEIIERNKLEGGHYVEPYAGGAGVAMELLLRDVVSCVHLNDASVPVYSFWYPILNYAEEFCRRISRATLNIEEWRIQKAIFKEQNKADILDLGFATFYLNRCNRSGILSAGVIGGLNQTGKWKMDARFSRNDLIKRIEAIYERRKKIKLKNLDAEKYILNYIPKLPSDTLVYLDPPYFKKADELYDNHYVVDDHKRIAELIQKYVKHRWVVSYDNAPEILVYYKQRKKFTYMLQYHAAKAYKGSEVFIFSDKLKIPNESSIPFINKPLENIFAR